MKKEVHRIKKLLLVYFFCLGLVSSTVLAQTFDAAANKYVFNGIVAAITKDYAGNTYIGGGFTRVGLWSGYGALLNSTTGVANTAFPKVEGTISTVVSIPSGGWYIGGSFTTINGITRNRLARINVDGTLHSFDPNMNSGVSALTLDASGNLYVGGDFTTVGSTTRNYLCQFDNTGALTTFNPNMGYGVNALAHDGSNLYVGGQFISVGSTHRNNLCKFDNTGALTAFNPNMNGHVNALAYDGSNLYVGGNFTSVGFMGRNRLCKFNNIGTLTAFNPNMNNFVYALVLDGSSNLYVGGRFTSISGTPRNLLCKFNNTGTLTAFNPNIDSPNGEVRALVHDGSNLYVGGDFRSISGTFRSRLCQFDASGTLTAFDPGMANSVYTLALDGNSNLYAGGLFTSVGGTLRNGLCKLDATGTLTAFDPNMNNYVNALVHDGSNLYAGGQFTTVGGSTTRNRLCKFDNTGALTAFDPNVSSTVSPFFLASVYALALDASGNLYAAGEFTTVGGTPRNNLCKFNNTGALTAFNPNINGTINALAHDGSNLYVGGHFSSAGGTLRYHLCQFNNTGALTAFDPNINGTINALAHDGSNLYVGGQFTSVGVGVNSMPRNSLCQFNNTGALMAFNPDMNSNVSAVSSVYALVLDGSGNLYVGGLFSSVGSTTRNGLCKFNNTGSLTAFNSDISYGVYTLAINGSNLYVGGSFTFPTPYLAIYTDAAVLPVELLSFSGKNTEEGNLLIWRTASETQNKGFDIEHSTDGMHFEKIGFVAGYGTINKKQDYNFTDEKPAEGNNYYRLKQMDYDDNFKYSHILTVKKSVKQERFVISPNPVSEVLNVAYTDKNISDRTIAIYDIRGNLIYEINSELQATQINTSNLQSGTYILKINQNGITQTEKFIKM